MKKITEKLTSKPSFTYYGVFLFFFSVALLTLGIVISKLVTEEKEVTKAAILGPKWTANGVAITDATNDQYSQAAISDGAEGYIIVWEDYRSGSDYDIYAQRIDNDGNSLWTEDGVVVSDATDWQRGPAIVSDGSGGAIITWNDRRAGSEYDIYAQRINSSGTSLWTEDGVVVSDATGNQVTPKVAVDGSSGAIVVWEDYRSGTNYDIYAQRINSSGVSQWTEDGVIVSDATGNQRYPWVLIDDANGVIAAWMDERSGVYDIYAQRLDSNGNRLWTPANGIVVCDATNEQWGQKLITDGTNGVIISWWDFRNDPTENVADIYAQRINSSGVAQWTANGVAVCDAADDQVNSQIVADGAGGAFIAWQDNRSGAFPPTEDIYAQHLNSSGIAQWTANGILVCDASGYQGIPTTVLDDSGGILIAWMDKRSGSNYDLYTQQLNSSGVPQWTDNGIVVSDAAEDQWMPLLIPDGSGGAICVWRDERSGSADIYAQRIVTLYQISNLASNLDAEDTSGNNIEAGSNEGLLGTSETVQLKDNDNGLVLSAIVVNMTIDRSWNSVSGDANLSAGKSVVANLTSAPGTASTHTLYVPIPSDGISNSVVICPNATTLAQVTESCSGSLTKTEADADTSKVTIDGQYYWKVEGLTSSGGICILEASPFNPEWGTCGTLVTDATNNQSNPLLVSDGSEGIIVAWNDYRSGSDWNIYSQRLDSEGTRLWSPANGVEICTTAGNQSVADIVPDGTGGAIITWLDYGDDNIYAQKVDSNGVVQWTVNGVAVINLGSADTIETAPDGSGGVIITWGDWRAGKEADIYAQRLNASGVVQWTANGEVVSNATNDQLGPRIISDGAGGAIITWEDMRGGVDNDVYAQRVNGSGVTQWTANGEVVCNGSGDQWEAGIVSDGSGGAIITWTDERSGNSDVYTQRLNSSGVAQWTANGVGIATGSNPQRHPKISSDGSGGAIITWQDTNIDFDVYAQRINDLGVSQWSAGGVAVTLAQAEEDLEITSDGSGGAFISWTDFRSGTNYDIYMQHIDNDGNALWAANGEQICDDGEDQYGGYIITDGDGGAILAWTDARSGSEYDIYAQRVGDAPPPPPPPPTTTTTSSTTTTLSSTTTTTTIPSPIQTNTKPAITIQEPNGEYDLASTTFTITWTDTDPDNNASISLYYDTDNEGQDGTLIVEGIEENDEDDEYSWDISQLEIGFYYVYGIIDDSVNDPVVNYSDGPLTKTNPSCEDVNSDEDPTNDDIDCDGMPDDWEEDNQLNPLDPTDADNDPDADDLTNIEEYQNDTNPHDADTDGDSIPDGWEVEHGLDPTDSSDAAENPDGDGCINYEEYINDTDPFTPDCNLVLPETGEAKTRSKTSQFVSDLGNFVGDQIKKLRENEALVTTTKTVGMPLAAIPVSGQLIALAFSISTALFITPAVLLPALLAFIKREKKNHWGIVYDIETKNPIPFAVVRLKREGTVTTKVTDLQGRYNLITTPGEYTLTISHSEYQEFSTNVKVKEDNSLSINTNIGLYPKEVALFAQLIITLRDFVNGMYDNLGYFLLIGGLLLAFFVWIVVPSTISFVIMLIYLPTLYIYHRSRTQYPSNWGRVLNSITRSPVKGAFVKIFMEVATEIRPLDTGITNLEGRYGFLLDKAGEYLILVAATGYKFPSKDNTLPTHFHESLVKVTIGKSKAFKEDLLVDPTEKKRTTTSPFSG